MDIYINADKWRVVIDEKHHTDGHVTFHTYPTGASCRLLSHEFHAIFKLDKPVEPMVKEKTS